jgi:hypothetical protein
MPFPPITPAMILFEDDYVGGGLEARIPRWQGQMTRDLYFELGHVTARFGRGRASAFEDWFVRRQKQARKVDVVAATFLSLPGLDHWFKPDCHDASAAGEPASPSYAAAHDPWKCRWIFRRSARRSSGISPTIRCIRRSAGLMEKLVAAAAQKPTLEEEFEIVSMDKVACIAVLRQAVRTIDHAQFQAQCNSGGR